MFSRETSSGQSMTLRQFWRSIGGWYLQLGSLGIAERRENKLFMGLSFETISSTGANAGEPFDLYRKGTLMRQPLFTMLPRKWVAPQ